MLIDSSNSFVSIPSLLKWNWWHSKFPFKNKRQTKEIFLSNFEIDYIWTTSLISSRKAGLISVNKFIEFVEISK